jgi:aminopeptidase N
VLSEGTTTYLTARAIEAVDGPTAAASVWTDYRRRLVRERGPAAPRDVWPGGCERHDPSEVYGGLVYVKGAYFYRALEQRIGRAELDAALAAAVARYRGRAATMQDVLDVIEASSGYDPDDCARAWLRATELPADIDGPCP